jgi:frataxin-like iron-binding protein CyaY
MSQIKYGTYCHTLTGCHHISLGGTQQAYVFNRLTPQVQDRLSLPQSGQHEQLQQDSWNTRQKGRSIRHGGMRRKLQHQRQQSVESASSSKEKTPTSTPTRCFSKKRLFFLVRIQGSEDNPKCFLWRHDEASCGRCEFTVGGRQCWLLVSDLFDFMRMRARRYLLRRSRSVF